ncbi:hypothetical protein STANM309S_06132 [Streptomyces tanashiensis]
MCWSATFGSISWACSRTYGREAAGSSQAIRTEARADSASSSSVSAPSERRATIAPSGIGRPVVDSQCSPMSARQCSP